MFQKDSTNYEISFDSLIIVMFIVNMDMCVK